MFSSFFEFVCQYKEKLPISVVSAFSPRIFIPWLIFVVVVAACIGIIIQQRTRNTGTPNDCIMGSWSEWTGCDDCTSIGVRTRNVAQQAESGGIPCKAFSRAETQSCDLILNCDDSSCQYTPWTPWTVCPTTCFRGLDGCNELPSQFRMRSVARPAFPGGTPCDWSTLIEQQPCLPNYACENDRSCVAAPDRPEDCIPCPSVGCTETTPFWTYCTRSILLSRTGAGDACTPEQLIYSQTCPLPNCTDECQAAYGYGQFSTCSKPCGTGWFVSSVTCPSITTDPCNTQTCPIGTMVLSQTSCTFVSSQSCDNAPSCLALCASDPTCNVVQNNFRGSATCVADTVTTSVWDPTATSCVEPTWEMVNATCLYVCEQNPSYSTERGIVFHYDDSNSLSCPITPSLLSSSQACPITPDPVTALITALWRGPYGASELVNFTDPYIPQEFTVACPESSDCQYQSWSDAPKWGQCTSGCVNGGIRHRQRAIVAPGYFLGIPCDVAEQNEYYGCNLRDEVASATEMMCLSPSITVSEVLCHQIWRDSSLSSLQVQTTTHGVGDEMFLYSNTNPMNLASMTAYTPPVGFQIATQQNLTDAYAKGFQACAPGWFATPALVPGILFEDEQDAAVVCPPYELGSTFSTHPWAQFYLSITDTTCTYLSSISLPSFTILGSVTCPWGYTFTGTTCSATVHAACEEGYYFTSRNGGGCALPLESEEEAAPEFAVSRINRQNTPLCPYANGLVTSNTAYVFLVGDKTLLPTALPFFTPYGMSSWSVSLTSQMYHDERVCAFNEDRLDTQLNDGYCFGFSNTVMYDKPCGAARNCSYTAWVDLTSCGTCIPPATKIQTRSIASQPSEGGQDCSAQPLITATDCFGPPCNSNENVCSYDPFPSTGCSSQFYPANVAYLTEWSTATINAYADYGISNLFNALSSMSDGSSLTNDIAWALNAQCTPALCLPSISETGEFLPFGFALNEDFGPATGWLENGCDVSEETLQCLGERIASYPLQNGSLSGSYVYNLDSNLWVSVSMCPYELNCCAWSDCSTCSINGSRTQTVSAGVRGGVSCGLIRTLSRNCDVIQMTPACANSLTCPVTTDGTPCNSQSGYGECVLSVTTPPTLPFYYCSCTEGRTGRACNNGCPVGSNGLTCSGRGVCDPNTEQCNCQNDWFGPVCDQQGPSSIGMLEMLLVQARMDWTVTLLDEYGGGTTVRKVFVTNTLPCDEESNAICAGLNVTGNKALTGTPAPNHPYAILDIGNSLSYRNYANICVNESDEGSSWVPPHSLLFTSSQVCQNLGIFPFNISARFTTHSSIPPSLHGTQFYTSCNVFNTREIAPYPIGFGSATQSLPCQYSNSSCREGDPEDAIFLLNGYPGSLMEFCTQNASPNIQLPAICDVDIAVDSFPLIGLVCEGGSCQYTYEANPNLPLVVNPAIVGATVTFPLIYPFTGLVSHMGLLLNCNDFPVTATDELGTVFTISSGHAILANYGEYATTLTVT